MSKIGDLERRVRMLENLVWSLVDHVGAEAIEDICPAGCGDGRTQDGAECPECEGLGDGYVVVRRSDGGLGLNPCEDVRLFK